VKPLLLRKSAAHKVLEGSEDDVISPRCLGRDAIRVSHSEKVSDFAAIQAVSQKMVG
jgi:hypothetical protein